MRKAAVEAAVNDMIKWFSNNEGLVAVLDATNSTKDRRRWIQECCEAAGIETLFVESKCDDEELIMSNIKEVKTTSPDYVGQDPEVAAQDFRERIRNYEKVYQTLDEDESDLTYCKLIDVGGQVVINKLKDYLQSRYAQACCGNVSHCPYSDTSVGSFTISCAYTSSHAQFGSLV